MSSGDTGIKEPPVDTKPAADDATDTTGETPRIWFALVLVALPLLAVITPEVTVWGGIALGAAVALMVVPPLREPLRILLRVSPGHPIHGTFKLVALFLYAGFLITAGRLGAEYLNRTQVETRQTANEPGHEVP